MTDEKLRINQLYYALGLAVGAFEAIVNSPHNFNHEGAANLLQRLKEIAELTFLVQGPEAIADGCEHGDFTENGVCGDCGAFIERIDSL